MKTRVRKQHRKLPILAYLGLSLLLAADAALAGTQITGSRLSSNTERTRLVFDLNGPARHTLFTLSKPERVVIDIEKVSVATALPGKISNSKLLKQLRSAPRNTQDLRIVLDLEQRTRPKSFLLKPTAEHDYRLVIDLFSTGVQKSQKPKKPVITAPKPDKLRDIVVVVDAGHGGKDPGAIGTKGYYEKTVVLDIAFKLAAEINRQRGMRAVLTRDRDKFLELSERIAIARKHRADLFISIHADGFHDKSARGSSVYALSLNGASSEAAKWLADKENAADLFGDVSLQDKDDLVASVLLDLSQSATIQSALEVGDAILQRLGKVNKLHSHSVQQASFIVLKSPDIPSILIETAFITNPSEEKKLRNKTHQSKLAKAVVAGLAQYYSVKAPEGTLLAHDNRKRRSPRLTAAF